MKRGTIALAVLSVIFLSSLISAECIIDASLINQDPYPAVPGDYVKLLFQLNGVENSECKNIYFELEEKYPISFDPGTNTITQIKAGTFTKSYSSFLMVPYKVRIDDSALNGDIPIEVRYTSSPLDSVTFPEVFFSKEFNINIKDVKTDFEIFVKNYDPSTKLLTFQILNIGESDVEALTIEIVPQKNVEIKGSSRTIVGSLDSNDFTTAEFEAVPEAGNIDLIVYYTDEINVRRSINESVSFNPSAFEGRGNGEGFGFTFYLIVFVIIAGAAYYFYRKHKREKRKKLLR